METPEPIDEEIELEDSEGDGSGGDESHNDSDLENTKEGKDGEDRGKDPPDKNKSVSSGGDCAPCGDCGAPGVGVGDPIYIQKGLYFTKVVDLCQASIRGELRWARYYWSGRQHAGQLGKDWRHSFERQLKLLPDGSAVEIDERGASTSFASDGAGGFHAYAKGNIRIVREADTSLSVLYASGRRFNYRADGKLNAIIDIKGNTTTLAYDSTQQLISVTDASGRGFQFTHDGGRIVRIDSSAGFQVTYTYDQDGRLKSASDTRGGLHSYLYREDGRLRQLRYPEDIEIDIAYDELNRVAAVSEKDPSGRVSLSRVEYPSENVRRFIDPLGFATTYEFDAHDLEIRRELPDGRIYTFERDDAGRLTTTHLPGGLVERWSYVDGKLASHTTPNGETTLVVRDPATGFPVATQHPDGSITRKKFDSEGNVISIKDEVGRETTFGHTPQGEVAQAVEPDGGTTTFAYDDLGDVRTITNALGQTTSLTHTATGDLALTTSAGGRATAHEYKGQHLRRATIDAAGHRTDYTYDDLGRIIEVALPNGGRTETRYVWLNGKSHAVTLKDPVGAQFNNEHDDAGHLIASIDPLGRRTLYARDSAGREIKVTRPDGSTIERVYNSRGLLETVKDPLGRITELRYDNNDRVIETIRPDGSSVVIDYDSRGRVSRVVAPDGSITRLEYNPAGDLVATVDALGNRTESFYGPGGTLDSLKDALGRIKTFERDALDRVRKTITAMGFASESMFDTDGNQARSTDAGGHAVDVTFDPLNRPIEARDPLGHTIKIGYDSLGNTTRLEDENGHAWVMEYDLAGRKIKEIDPNGRSITFTWDLAGQLIHQAFQDGSSITQRHDDLGRLIERVYTRADGTVEDVETTEYDLGGRRTLQENAVVRIQSTPDIMDREVLRRILFKKTGILRTLGFGYDAVGRRTLMVDDSGRMLKYGWNKRGELEKLEILEPVVEKEKHCKVRVWHVPPGNPKGAHEVEVDIKGLLAHLAHGDRMAANGDRDEPPGGRRGRDGGHGDGGHGDEDEDDDGEPTPSIGYTTRTYNFKTDPVGNLVQTIYPNLTRTRRVYDADNRLEKIVHEQLGSGGDVVNVLESFTFARDGDGLIQTITEADGDVWRYRHNERHELVRQEMPERLYRELRRARDGGHGENDDDDGDHGGGHAGGGADHRGGTRGAVPDIARVTEWVPDPAGNRIEEIRDGRSIASTYSPANELETSGEWRFEQDARGNEISRQRGNDPKERFLYSVKNMLVSYGKEEPGKAGKGKKGAPVPPVVRELERYFYDPDHQRVGLLDVTKGELTNFLYEAGRPIEEFVVTPGRKGATAKGVRYAWSMGQMLEQQAVAYNAAIPLSPTEFVLGEAGAKAGARQHGLVDHLGSIRLLTDEVGRPVDRASWCAWGEGLEGGAKSRFGFTGHQTERASGHRYSVHRYLDPRNGRWTQRDPIGFAGGDSNLYRYVANGPVGATDPLGLVIEVNETLPNADIIRKALEVFRRSDPLTYDRLQHDPNIVVTLGGNTSADLGRFGDTWTKDQYLVPLYPFPEDPSPGVTIYFKAQQHAPHFANSQDAATQTNYAAWVLAHEFQHVLGYPNDVWSETDPFSKLIEAELKVLDLCP